MAQDDVSVKILGQIIDWVEDNDAQFVKNGEKLYDEENLKRITRFAYAPLEYLDERIELNKAVLKDYHKLHQSILIAGFTGFYAIVFSQSILELVKTTEITQTTYNYVALIILLLISAYVATRIRLTSKILKYTGLLRVIRDSEIEIYYLTKIKEHRIDKSGRVEDPQ